MKKTDFEILENTRLTRDVWRLLLSGDTEGLLPGQFVNIAVPGRFLRRPISVCDVEAGKLTLLYKVVGEGTRLLSALPAGEKLELLTGLGTGYDLTLSGERPLLIGGGVGVPPLFFLAKRLLAEGKKPTVLLGFNTKEEIFHEFTFLSLGCAVIVTTVDGSYGVKGFVTDAMPEGYTHVYACGPLPMLKAVWKKCETDGQFSLEERMGCGFGACMGCSIQTAAGAKRVCKDGPVFRKGVLLWAD